MGLFDANDRVHPLMTPSSKHFICDMAKMYTLVGGRLTILSMESVRMAGCNASGRQELEETITSEETITYHVVSKESVSRKSGCAANIIPATGS